MSPWNEVVFVSLLMLGEMFAINTPNTPHIVYLWSMWLQMLVLFWQRFPCQWLNWLTLYGQPNIVDCCFGYLIALNNARFFTLSINFLKFCFLNCSVFCFPFCPRCAKGSRVTHERISKGSNITLDQLILVRTLWCLIL